jgi:hypothetical protein
MINNMKKPGQCQKTNIICNDTLLGKESLYLTNTCPFGNMNNLIPSSRRRHKDIRGKPAPC